MKLVPGNGVNQVNENPQMRSAINMDPDFLMARSSMQHRICDILLQRQQQPVTDEHRRKVRDLAKRLEEGMLKSARSKEDYMNLDTLETRLSNFLRRASMNNHNQQHPQLVGSSPIGTMIPTPGMSHVPKSSMVVTSSMDVSMIAASGCNSLVSTSFNNVSMLPAGGMFGSSLNKSDGLSNGYQQSSTSFSVGLGTNMSSTVVQRNGSQMIPTPGFNVSINHSSAEGDQAVGEAPNMRMVMDELHSIRQFMTTQFEDISTPMNNRFDQLALQNEELRTDIGELSHRIDLMHMDVGDHSGDTPPFPS